MACYDSINHSVIVSMSKMSLVADWLINRQGSRRPKRKYLGFNLTLCQSVLQWTPCGQSSYTAVVLYDTAYASNLIEMKSSSIITRLAQQQKTILCLYFRFADHVHRGGSYQFNFSGHVPGVLSGTASTASWFQQLHSGKQYRSIVDRWVQTKRDNISLRVLPVYLAETSA